MAGWGLSPRERQAGEAGADLLWRVKAATHTRPHPVKTNSCPVVAAFPSFVPLILMGYPATGQPPPPPFMPTLLSPWKCHDRSAWPGGCSVLRPCGITQDRMVPRTLLTAMGTEEEMWAGQSAAL